jgi:hypothetical protein
MGLGYDLRFRITVGWLAPLSNNEQALFLSFLRCSRRYLEFGSGGGTFAAALAVTEAVISIDSSKDWLQTVEDACKSANVKAQPRLLHVDIGELKDWGYPKNDSRRADWPSYHSLVWELEGSKQADSYLVDGRFRVACFSQIIFKNAAASSHCCPRFRGSSPLSCYPAIWRRDCSVEQIKWRKIPAKISQGIPPPPSISVAKNLVNGAKNDCSKNCRCVV